MLYQHLTETDADAANFWTEVRDPYGKVRRRTRGDEGDCNPRGIVSTHEDSSVLPGAVPCPPKSMHGMDMRLIHICSTVYMWVP